MLPTVGLHSGSQEISLKYGFQDHGSLMGVSCLESKTSGSGLICNNLPLFVPIST